MTVQYQGVWSLQSAAQLQSTQRWVTDPLFENTTLLLQADDAANGAQNNTFLDSSSNSFAITRNPASGPNAPTQGSFTPFSSQPGAWSNYFDGGTTTRLTLSSSADFAFGTGAYTMEASVFITSRGSNDSIVFDCGAATNALGFTVTTTGQIALGRNGVGNIFTSGAGIVPLNQWVHIVIARTSTSTNDTRMYANGILVATGTDSNNHTVTTTPSIGGANSAGFSLIGYISNLRIIKGSAVTPPSNALIAPLTDVPNTVLLTCQSYRFFDANTQVAAKTLTVNGPISVQAFSPFAPQFQWTPSVIGGSGYFDGTGDWINVADSTAFTLGSGNFTVEFWVYSTTAGVRQFFAGQVNSAGANTATSFSIEKTSGNKLLGAIYSGVTQYPATSSGDIPLNAWTHIALVRDGNTLRQYINGVQDGTASVTGVTVNDSSNQLSIGRLGELASNNYFGYVSNFRFVNGTAVYTGAFTPPIAPVTTSGPASSYSSTTNVNTTFTATNTALLTNFTNAGIYDATMKNNLETVGNAQISTAVVKYGSGSLAFDGNGDYLTTIASPNINLTSGDFTIECWIYVNALTAGEQQILNKDGVDGASFTQYALAVTSAGTLLLYLGNGNGLSPTQTSYTFGTVNTSVWYHVAAVRTGSTIRTFLNGNQITSTAQVTAMSEGNKRLFIGYFQGGAASTFYNGYLDDLRITKGIARYTQNFIPPSVALPRQ